MAVASILRVLLIAVITRSRCEPPNGHYHNNAKSALQFGELLKPPPPPHSNKIPVPFHGGSSRVQRQNSDVGYIYQPPPPPPPPPVPPSANLKYAVPFYKPYNFNFVPPSQSVTTTPSSLIQKVSGWLFPSQQTSYGPPAYSSINLSPLKKDCNPCNLVPWIPVIRLDLAAKNIKHNLIPTYGPPSPNLKQILIPTYGPPSPNFKNLSPYPFYQPQNLSPAVPHAVYGQPVQSNNLIRTPSSTYGPPSPTHIISTASQNPSSSPYSFDSSSIAIPSSTYGVSSSSYGAPSSAYGVPSSTYGTPSSTYATPSPSYASVTPNYEPSVLNSELPQQTGIESEIEPANELHLPKYSHPLGIKNSYGEPISNTYSLGIPYSVSATAAESTKIKTEISPNGQISTTSNMSLALANPAPFTKGRNIHTLQPVALPNLSVSPLPPIFNAQPFRPLAPKLNTSVIQGLNYMQQLSNNINIDQSIPIAEFTQSVDYPPSVIKPTVIDIDSLRSNQTKAYRYIQNGFILDEIRDISSQASEDHVSATKTNQDVSFESTGVEFGNDLYDTGLPSDLQQSSNIPSNHNNGFGDLRGIKDEDIDKYRTESNLQNIDSPLLYLKPNAPHKDYRKFVLAISSTPSSKNEYEIYDEIPTTSSPQLSTLSSWDESRTEYSKVLLPPRKHQEEESKPRLVQIIVPYTTSQQEEIYNNFDTSSQDWASNSEEEYQGRKVPSNTEESYINTASESYNTVSTTEEPFQSVTEHYDSDRLNTHAILNDLYDVKEPPFDIIKLQHTIDDWTEQEYSKLYKQPHKTRHGAKYAKQIPDEYFTTISPISNYVTAASNYNYEIYDHEGSSSMHHTVTEVKNNTTTKSHKEYNTIERKKPNYSTSAKNEVEDEVKKPHIYTAASSFRSSTSTTPAPWGKIQTSISPLTKEKVYVVTSKPWLEIREKINEWYNVESFESKKTSADNDVSASDNLPFKSPRFSNRPSFGFTSSGEGKIEPLKSDSSYGFSKSWYQSINDLETQAQNRTLQGGPQQNITTNNNTEETDT